MSIVLKDGTVLPDFPSDYWENFSSEYPYYLILGNPGADGEYVAQFIPTKSVYVPAEYSGLPIGMVMSSEGALGTWSYMTGPEIDYNWAAGLLGGEDFIFSTLSYSQTEEPVILYANHDILTATGVDTSTGTITVGDEVYFPNSEAKPPFILPDGTELPALPEGCFEKYPYGYVMKREESGGTVSYFLVVIPSASFYLPDNILGSMGCDTIYPDMEASNGCAIWVTSTDDTWTFDEGDSGENMTGLMPVGTVPGESWTHVWSNHDVYIVTGVDEENDKFISSSDLYRRSDVNYRISGGRLNSLANQARRLGSVSGGLNVGEMETAIKTAQTAAGVVDGTITSFRSETLTRTREYAFWACTALQSVDLPNLITVDERSFVGCAMLTEVYLPNVESILIDAFYMCAGLTKIDLPKATRISAGAFYGCGSLFAVILRNETMCVLDDSGAFSGSLVESGTGYIYVPSALVDTYKADANWSTYAAQIRAIEDYPDICGTT